MEEKIAMGVVGSRQERLQKILSEKFSPLFLEVENESHQHSVPEHSETHFKVLMVSNFFNGLSRLDRQRAINEALKIEFQQGLHALSQRLYTAEEWAQSPENYDSPLCHTKKP